MANLNGTRMSTLPLQLPHSAMFLYLYQYKCKTTNTNTRTWKGKVFVTRHSICGGIRGTPNSWTRSAPHFEGHLTRRLLDWVTPLADCKLQSLTHFLKHDFSFLFQNVTMTVFWISVYFMMFRNSGQHLEKYPSCKL